MMSKKNTEKDEDDDSASEKKKTGVFERVLSLRKRKKVNYSDEEVEDEQSTSQEKDSFHRSGSKRKSMKKPSSSVPTRQLSDIVSKENSKQKEPGKVKGLWNKLLGRHKQETTINDNSGPSTSKAIFPSSNEYEELLSDSPPSESETSYSEKMKRWPTQVVFPPSNEFEESSNNSPSRGTVSSRRITKWKTHGNLTTSSGPSENLESDDHAIEQDSQRAKQRQRIDKLQQNKSKVKEQVYIYSDTDEDSEYTADSNVRKQRHFKKKKKQKDEEYFQSDSDKKSDYCELLYLGKQDNECYFCGALHLPGCHYCCSKGRIFIPPFPKIAEPLKTYLFDVNSKQRKHFTQNTMQYNSFFSFASIQRHRLKAAKYGPQVEKCQGPLRHFPSAAYPKDPNNLQCGNYYVYDPEEATEKRVNAPFAENLDKKIIADITAYLHLHNHFATMYKTMADCMKEAQEQGNNPEHLRLKIIDPHVVSRKMIKNQHPGIYKTKTHGRDFLSVFYDSSLEQEIRYPGLNIYPKRSNRPSRPIFPWMSEISPLCYPILFPRGEAGWKSNKYPIVINRERSWKERLEAHARFYPDEARLWDTDTEEEQEARTHLPGDPHIEISDEEYDENMAHGYYDTHLDQIDAHDKNDGMESTHVTFVERNGEQYPVRRSDDEPHVDSNKMATLADEMEDSDSNLSETQFEHPSESDNTHSDEEDYSEATTTDTQPTVTEKDAILVEGKHEEPICPATEKKHRAFASFREYALFIHQKRKRFKNRISASKKLGQLFTIDMDTRLRQFRNSEIRKHFTEYLSSTPKKFMRGYLKRAKKKGITIGCATSVPSTVPGSPRHQQNLFENIVHLANKDKPDIFGTFTCNVFWKEIQENLEPGTSWEDNPFLVNEVFLKKWEIALEDMIGKKIPGSKLRTKGIFGKVVWYTYSVEFQARGPPHVHFILSLEKHIETAFEVDEVCQAQLPVVPEDPNHPDYERQKRLRELVETFMIHRPCKDDPDAYCQQNKKKHWEQCTKRYPKKLSRFTKLDDRQYPELCRPDNGEFCLKKTNIGMVPADNSYVVPHNLHILSRYECHCNIEVISSLRVIKYIFKYIFKGFDRVLVESLTNTSNKTNADQMTLEGHLFVPKSLNIPKGILEERKKDAEARLKENNVPLLDKNGRPVAVYDETYLIEDMRSTTAPEAAWDIMGLPRSGCSHVVVPLFVHAPDEEPITMEFGEEAQTATYSKITTEEIPSRLKSWFKLNKSTNFADQKARSLTFNQLPEKFVYEKNTWRHRKRITSAPTMGRIKSVSPRNLEQFAIRLLATSTKGPTSFEDLRTVDGVVYPTFADACRRRGLMNDEAEWDYALTEAEQDKMPLHLRRMFITILLFCAPKDPKKLWDAHKAHLVERRQDWTESKKEAHALRHISLGLQYHGTCLSNFGLPEFCVSSLPEAFELMEDESNSVWSSEQSRKLGQSYREKLTDEQRIVFETILTSVESECTETFFIEGTGGSGKTFVYRTLYHELVGMGYKVLCVAHTGVASILLPQGSTAHRTFAIPLTTEETMNCKIDLESNEAIDLSHVSVVLWDEITMTDYRILHAVHKLMTHIHPDKAHLPFGGCTFVFGGDFRQTLPIVAGVHDSAVINYTIKGSELWKNLKILHLHKNMRACLDIEFANWLEGVGNGTANLDQSPREVDQEIVIPEKLLVKSEKILIEEIFGGGKLCDHKLSGSVILTVDNRTSLQVNEKILNMVTGEEVVFNSVDTYDDTRGFAALDVECYNNLTPSGLPPHELKLKVNCIVILLRNLDVRRRLCNGTRLRVLKIQQNVLSCVPLKCEDEVKELIYIHRIMLSSSAAPTRELSFTRKQFPLRLAYSMTVNKAQGNTFDKVGLLLRSPVFAHGQLYVALSRVRTFSDLLVYNSDKKNPEKTSNVVFRQALV